MHTPIELGTDISNELLGLVAEPRLQRRAKAMLEMWQDRPGLGFPDIFNTEASLEGAYRFFGNPSLDFETLLLPHVEKSIERCGQAEENLCIHDTSTFVFSGERQGFGSLPIVNRIAGYPRFRRSKLALQAPKLRFT